jgi:hypothetical protein
MYVAAADDWPGCWAKGMSVWSDHANFISTAYAGTGAMKTDFTRTGKRTKEGALEDGKRSLMRYIKNNLFDGPRQVCCFVRPFRRLGSRLCQDGYDLVTGTWIPRQGPQTALFLVTDNRPLLIRAVSVSCA